MDSMMQVLETHQQDTAAVYAYCQLATELLGTDDKLAKEYAYRAQSISQRLNKPGLEAWAKNLIGLAYDYLGVPDSALLFYQGSIEIKRRLNDIDGMALGSIGVKSSVEAESGMSGVGGAIFLFSSWRSFKVNGASQKNKSATGLRVL